MTGYVRPCKARLSESAWDTYRAAYCGVCRALGRRYGPAYRFLLSYDLVFYALLIAREPFEERFGRCAVRPSKRRIASPNPALDAAADATVLLACGQLRDHAADSGFWGRAASHIGLSAMKTAYRKAAGRLPQAARAMDEQLIRLAELERERTPSLDRPADTFSTMLAALADDRVDSGPRRRVCRETLRHLGRWIYLIDAADDFSGDVERGLYNPLAARYGGESADIRDQVRRTIGHSRVAAMAAFELDDTQTYTGIVGNILTYGLCAAESRVFNLGGRRLPPDKDDDDGPLRSAGCSPDGVDGRDQEGVPGLGGEVPSR